MPPPPDHGEATSNASSPTRLQASLPDQTTTAESNATSHNTSSINTFNIDTRCLASGLPIGFGLQASLFILNKMNLDRVCVGAFSSMQARLTIHGQGNDTAVLRPYRALIANKWLYSRKLQTPDKIKKSRPGRWPLSTIGLAKANKTGHSASGFKLRHYDWRAWVTNWWSRSVFLGENEYYSSISPVPLKRGRTRRKTNKPKPTELTFERMLVFT